MDYTVQSGRVYHCALFRKHCMSTCSSSTELWSLHSIVFTITIILSVVIAVLSPLPQPSITNFLGQTRVCTTSMAGTIELSLSFSSRPMQEPKRDLARFRYPQLYEHIAVSLGRGCLLRPSSSSSDNGFS
ncbi:MICOS complex subunit mic19 [Fusarium oxysporum f. sp. albedinis]|nr:MICOS complex subunit mic19 [Fusarium oxysporum f. sp. albedinis]